MHPKARVNGNVHYKVIEMIAGSTLTGRLVHTETVAVQDTNVTPITPDVAIA
jgi:cytoskeletal protein CcmA (bactofilin family)